MQALGQGIGGLGYNFGQEGVFAEEITDEQVLFDFVGEVISSDLLPQAIGDVSGEHQFCRGRGLVLGAASASADIICYICINVGPVYCLSCLCLHPLHPYVGSMQVIEGMGEEFWWNTEAASLEEEASLYGQLITGAPELSGDP